jgi:type III pantothenate kinase
VYIAAARSCPAASSWWRACSAIPRASSAAARGAAAGRGIFARSTRAAIDRGAIYAAAALVDRAVREARAVLPAAPLVLLTGGAARQLVPLIRSKHVHVPDLVLRGLAVYAGLRLDLR